jgi:hypothetical protein
MKRVNTKSNTSDDDNQNIKNVKIDASSFFIEDKEQHDTTESEESDTEQLQAESEREEEEVEEQTVQNISKSLEKMSPSVRTSDVEIASPVEYDSEPLSGGATDDDDDDDEDEEIIDMTDDKLSLILSAVLEDEEGENVSDNLSKIVKTFDHHNKLMEKLIDEVKTSQKAKESETTVLRTMSESIKTQNNLLEKISKSFELFLKDQFEEEVEVADEDTEEEEEEVNIKEKKLERDINTSLKNLERVPYKELKRNKPVNKEKEMAT